MLCKKLSIFMVCAAVVLNSHAMDSSDVAVDSHHAAKHGSIVNFYIPDTPDINLPQCLATLTKQELASRRFVTVQYRHVRHMFYTIAELPSTMQANVNDQVEFWPEDCARGKISRILRVTAAVSE